MLLMGNLVDQRYAPVYGTVYALADVGICAGFCVGKNFKLIIIKKKYLIGKELYIGKKKT